ncbi:pumilio homolog 5 [Cryptomeria japonica]|uniref:pumilio homolog 5 n=1 Tax=Cryptomeria japonica TaxID=3369 RepID=UPI0025AB5E8D|nr:pumilio homolog 5 [Cryptomeria japonica]XP_057837274.1 pumilio homolog 5 [Cryptomeria japonica]
MATENPMRLISGGDGARNWSTRSENLRFASFGDGAEEELGSLLKGQKFGNNRQVIPNRSGSAPPTVEGSLTSLGGLFPHQNSSFESNWDGVGDAVENLQLEDKLRGDPGYLAYHYSHNLNPRLPRGENRRLAHNLGALGNKQKLRSFDDSNSRSLFSSRPVLPTHKEEPEEERYPGVNPRQFSTEWLEMGSDYFSGTSSSLLGGRPKSLVDLIQEDFPRTPSPVYTLSRSSSRAANDEGIDANSSLEALMYIRESAMSSVKGSELSSTRPGSRSATPTPSGIHILSVGSTSDSHPAAPVARIPSPDSPMGSTKSGSQGEALIDEIAGLTGGSIVGNSELKNTMFSAASTSEVSNLAETLQGFNIADVHNVEDNSQKKQQQLQQEHDEDQPHHYNLAQEQYQRQQRVLHVPLVQGQVQSQASTQVHQQHQHHSGIDHAVRNQSKFGAPNMMQGSAVGLQPTFQPSTPPAAHLYPAAYLASGNPYYQNVQSAFYAPQYGISGYPMNATVFPSMISGYPHGSMPMAFDNTAAAVAASMNARAAATASPGGGMGIGVDMQQLYKFNGQLGATLQPSFTDPTYLQYMQRSSEDAYNSSMLGDSLAGRGFIGGSQMDALELHKASILGFANEHKSQFTRNGALGVPIAGRSGSVSPAYYGSPPNLGFLMQYPSSPSASPVLPGSPVIAASLLARPNERNLRLPLGANRVATMGAYSGWQSQRGNEKLDDVKCSSFLEELKNNKTHRFELSDIAGHIVEFSADQQGSRFIQQKLETSNSEEKALVFQEVLPQASTLMTDVFGNYVIQKFFEHGTDQQRQELANQLVGHVLTLSLQMYGCRVVQKALEVVDVDMQTQLVSELDGNVMRCVRDQNGNHVIQKCIESVPTDRIQFIISSFYGQVVNLSMHPYGCRVIQRVLEHCTEEQKDHGIMEEILQAACSLAQDQYGNYVAQHVLEHGKPHERSEVINKLAGQFVQMSQHKFASNVVEKCLEYGNPTERQMLIDEMLGQTEENDNLQTMMKDQYANYVVQKVLETCDDVQREKLLARIRLHLHALKKYTYGKHIVARVEKLLAVGEKWSSQT